MIKYTKITKSLLREGEAGRYGFYEASNFGCYGVPEFIAFGDTVCTVE